MSTLTDIDKIVDKFSECEIDEYYYDGCFGYVTIWCNPYEEQVWPLLTKIRNNIEDIRKINIGLAVDKDEDYDIIEINYIDDIKERNK